MKKYRNPLSRSLLLSGLVLIVLLCLIQIGMGYIEYHRTRDFRFMLMGIGGTVFVGGISVTLWLVWLEKRVIEPIQTLEKGVLDFAEKTRNGAKLEKMVLDIPEISTGDEIESLYHSLRQMSEDIMNYAERLSQATDEVESMKTRISRMGILAYKDALTQVKNKASYDEEKLLTDQEIAEGTAEFAVLMIDLNHLKRMNDTYGHEHGNSYIQLSCRMICVVFAHSPVFRIGGDEFVVILKKGDYEKRERLLEILREDFDMTSHAEELEPWERASAAMGLAVYDKEKDTCVDDVFKRADERMYENKKAMKGMRE
ncbi:MAG: GGDEF domain-containing protein [Lachnospiraceae bacterium]|nr:GGDEF domain-containing protein [Lachnospiraceae bacterium]